MVKLEDISTFEDFLRVITAAGSIRLVKLEDYGFTAPVNRDGAVVIEPRVRLVATAFDKQRNTLYRWQETTDARQVVSVKPLTGRRVREEVLMEKDRVRQLLQLEGFSVEKGEWTPDGVETLLGRTGT
jgi:hypothetical protein